MKFTHFISTSRETSRSLVRSDLVPTKTNGMPYKLTSLDVFMLVLATGRPPGPDGRCENLSGGRVSLDPYELDAVLGRLFILRGALGSVAEEGWPRDQSKRGGIGRPLDRNICWRMLSTSRSELALVRLKTST